MKINLKTILVNKKEAIHGAWAPGVSHREPGPSWICLEANCVSSAKSVLFPTPSDPAFVDSSLFPLPKFNSARTSLGEDFVDSQVFFLDVLPAA